MAAPKGNQFWKQRSRHGRHMSFSSKEHMWESACEYFEWIENNPFLEEKASVSHGEVIRYELARPRPMTMAGLCIFLDITYETWRTIRKLKEFTVVSQKVEEVIRDQKFSGAAAGFFNSNIIAMELGLKNKVEHVIDADVKVNIDPEKEMEKRGIPIPDVGAEDL